MDENNELLMYIYKTSEMGFYSTRSLLNSLKNRENKIKDLLECELNIYEDFYKKSKKILEKNNKELKGNSLLVKMSSDLGIMMETMKDNSDSSIASMLSQGFMMGINEINSKISKYKNSCDKKTIKLAKHLLKFQENEISNLKTFI